VMCLGAWATAVPVMVKMSFFSMHASRKWTTTPAWCYQISTRTPFQKKKNVTSLPIFWTQFGRN
jgi:hypothetical protein